MLRARQSRVRIPPRMVTAQLPAPVKGLNLRRGISSLKEEEALILDNWFCKGGYVQVRGGYESHATGVGASIGTLMEWAGPASRKMFAATANDIFEVTSSGAVGAAAASTLTNAYWQQVMFTTSGGHFLVICNGADSVRNYDGSSWTTPAITGVTSANLINVASYKSRLWFVEKDSTKAWFLGTSSISGAATSLELGDKFRRGGKLQLIGTISRDAGNGAQDVICFVSSRGEVVAFQGSDPSDTNNWLQIGVYMAAPPIGNRALTRIDGDLALLTERGMFSVRQVAAGGLSAAERSAITGNVDQGIIDDFLTRGTLAGWESIVHPRTRQLIINVPRSTTSFTQYAMSTMDGAWCTYGRLSSPLNATCWGMLSENLYFGTSGGTVYRAERGFQDAGSAITATVKTGFHSFGEGGVFRTSMVRPLFTAGGRVLPSIRINVDYRNTAPTSADEYPGISGAAGAQWDVDLWDVGVWGESDSPQAEWLSAQGIGTTASIHMIIRPNGMSVKLNSFDLQIERAQGLGL